MSTKACKSCDIRMWRHRASGKFYCQCAGVTHHFDFKPGGGRGRRLEWIHGTDGRWKEVVVYNNWKAMQVINESLHKSILMALYAMAALYRNASIKELKEKLCVWRNQFASDDKVSLRKQTFELAIAARPHMRWMSTELRRMCLSPGKRLAAYAHRRRCKRDAARKMKRMQLSALSSTCAWRTALAGNDINQKRWKSLMRKASPRHKFYGVAIATDVSWDKCKKMKEGILAPLRFGENKLRMHAHISAHISACSRTSPYIPAHHRTSPHISAHSCNL